ncbi:MAG: glycoside hydrolase family 88 protein [Clostridia bacterium]|nr:glycoside hydrolase family 88 protein [Clostridia bacterium]
MSCYFPSQDSAAALLGSSKEAVIRLLADRFMQVNPPAPFVWRSFDEAGIQADKKGGYHFDFDVRFPAAAVGDRAIAVGNLYCPQAKGSRFNLRCHNPAEVYLNGERVFVSTGAKERSGENDVFSVSLNEGFNRFVILAEKTKIGFSCVLQNAMPQWEPCNYVMPFARRGGEAGFVYALLPAEQPLPDVWGDDEPLPFLLEPVETSLAQAGEFAALAAFDMAEAGCIAWHKPQGVTLLVDGGDPAACLAAGPHQVMMRGSLADLAQVQGEGVALHPPVPVHGRCTPYLVYGPVQDGEIPALGRVGAAGTWRPALQGMALRPYVESALFGRWTYPLGVTLYGMLRAGGRLNAADLTAYVQQHVQQVTGIHEYAEYDTERYGFAGVNQQICWLDALDDCGSFGALMLRCDPTGADPDVRRMADRIAHYMMQEQPRTAEGAFCRRDDTIWADDMYMSVPFLCRYAELTGDEAPLDFAAEQMLHYKQLLFLPEKQVMAHMRCLIHGENNGIPWSRGNGWVIFSLSELLQVLPPEHPRRPALLDFFNQLTQGYLALQDECGLWHQILDDPESYLESSATAMMICAFSRGKKFGWYDEATALRAMAAARKAWQGLTEIAIDRQGNLYGVCQGSGFSFSRAYYRALSWRFNDTHGIGIVMLAGVELLEAE